MYFIYFIYWHCLAGCLKCTVYSQTCPSDHHHRETTHIQRQKFYPFQSLLYCCYTLRSRPYEITVVKGIPTTTVILSTCVVGIPLFMITKKNIIQNNNNNHITHIGVFFKV